MTYSYYVYYRVSHTRQTDCRKAVQQVLEGVMQSTGIAGRLLTKRDEPLLWMEVYENVSNDASFESRLAEAVAHSGMQDYLQPESRRHIECFES